MTRQALVVRFCAWFLIFTLLLTLSCSDDKSTDTSDDLLPDEPTQITQQGTHPTVSADGKWLVYQGSPGIYKCPSGGGDPVKVFDYGLEPDWSWTHNLILIRDWGIVVIDPENGDSVASVSVPMGFDDDPCWSPEGDEIAAQWSRGILTLSYPDGDTATVSCSDPIDDDPFCEGECPTWSPDGEWLAFEDGLQILKVRRSGGTAVPVVDDMRDVSYPAWSPDGKWIAFLMQDTASSNAHIWVVDSRGIDHGMYQVTEGDYIDRLPAWSPDSRHIYFDRSAVDSTYYYTPLGIWRVGFKSE